jgi:hypothetical protein
MLTSSLVPVFTLTSWPLPSSVSTSAPGPSIVSPAAISGRSPASVIVPLTPEANVIVLPAESFAPVSAPRSEQSSSATVQAFSEPSSESVSTSKTGTGTACATLPDRGTAYPAWAT